MEVKDIEGGVEGEGGPKGREEAVFDYTGGLLGVG
jgi:hypothetical protein